MVVLTFRVAQFSCAFRVEHVQEIVAIPATVRVPGQPAILEGFLNLRGRHVPVVRMATLFDLPVTLHLYSPVIILRNGTNLLGLLVDEVKSVLTLTGKVSPLTPGHSANEYAEGKLSAEEDEVVLLDSTRVLLAEEQHRIAQLEQHLKRRRDSIEAAGG